MNPTMAMYREALACLARNETQVLMVSCTTPGIGVVTTAREVLGANDRAVLEIRCEMLTYNDDFKPVPYLRNGEIVHTENTPFQELILKAKRENSIVILDGVDIFFRPGSTDVLLEHLIEAVKTGVRMVWIGGEDFKAVCMTGPKFVPGPTVMFPDITITDEDLVGWLGKQVPHWDMLSEAQRNTVLDEARKKGLRAAISSELVRNFKWGPPGISKGETI